MGQIDSFKRVLGVSEAARPEPPSPRRTSISLSRRTYARLECYYFWLEHHGGKHYPSFGAFLEDLLDEALSGNSKATAFFVRRRRTRRRRSAGG